MEKTHKKITNGFVIQDYKRLPNGTLVCTGQEFIAGDVDYENDDGEQICDLDIAKEVYCPFEMKQPKDVPDKSPTFKLMSDFDGNDEIELQSDNLEDAACEGLNKLNWLIMQK